MPVTTVIYSVWNAPAKAYDYYTATESYRAFAPDRKLKNDTVLGTTVEKAAWLLPSSAKKVGQGAFAKGAIAEISSGRSLGLFEGDFTTSKVALMAVGAYIAWRVLRR